MTTSAKTGAYAAIADLIAAPQFAERGATLADLVLELGLKEHAAGQARLGAALSYLREQRCVRAEKEQAENGRRVWRYWPLRAPAAEGKSAPRPLPPPPARQVSDPSEGSQVSDVSSEPPAPATPEPPRRRPGRPRLREATWARANILNAIALEPEGLTMLELAKKLGVGPDRRERVCLSTALHGLEAAGRIERTGWRRLLGRPGRLIVWTLGPVERGEQTDTRPTSVPSAATAEQLPPDPLRCSTCDRPLTPAEFYELGRRGRLQFCDPDPDEDEAAEEGK